MRGSTNGQPGLSGQVPNTAAAASDHAAVSGNSRAGDPAGGVGGQERDNLGEVLQLSQGTRRRAGGHRRVVDAALTTSSQVGTGGPGSTLLTVIERGPSSCDAARTNASPAALLAAYSPLPGRGRSPAREITMTRPPSGNRWVASRSATNVALVLAANAASTSASQACAISTLCPTPALLTTTSSRPKCSTAHRGRDPHRILRRRAAIRMAHQYRTDGALTIAVRAAHNRHAIATVTRRRHYTHHDYHRGDRERHRDHHGHDSDHRPAVVPSG